MQEEKSGLIPEQFIQTVIEKADLYDHISRIVTLKSSNANSYKGLCPFHNEKTPSFYVHRDKQYFHCFGCGANGNVIKFTMQTKNLTFPDAIKSLAEELNLKMPTKSSDNNAYPQAYALLNKTQAMFQNALTKNPVAKKYLIERGLSNQTIATFGIGLACDFNMSKEEQELAKTIGLLNIRNRSYFFDRITFPIHNTIGKVVGFGGRVFADGQPKYLNSKESFIFHKSEIIYGLYQAKQEKQNYVVVVEGYMDVVSLYEHGIKNAVATLGTAITTKHINLLFKHYDKIAFCFDGDTAGQKAAWRTLVQTLPILGDGKEIKFIVLPEGEDPDSLVKKHGRDGWRTLLANSFSFETYFFNHLDNNYPKETISEKAKYAKTAQELIDLMQNSFIKQLMQKQLAKTIETSIESKQVNTSRPNLKLNNLEQAIKILIHNPKLAAICEVSKYFKNSDMNLCKLYCDVVELCINRDFQSLASLKVGSKSSMLYPDIKRFAAMPFDEIDESMLHKSLSTELLKAELTMISELISSNINNSDNKLDLKNLLSRKSEIINLLNKLREQPNDR